MFQDYVYLLCCLGILACPLLLMFIIFSVTSSVFFHGYITFHFHFHLGSRVGYINMEVRSELAPILNRKCVFVKWVELTADKFDNLLDRGMGAIVVILQDSVLSASAEENSKWMELERILLLKDIKIPVYFVTETPELLEVMNNINSDASANSGSSALSSEGSL